MSACVSDRINVVLQQHDNGCAVACVAMVTGVSYADAFKAAFGPRSRRSVRLELTLSQVAGAIRSLGFRCRHGSDWLSGAFPAVLMFEWDHDIMPPGTFHCVAYDPFRRRVVDPGGTDFSQARYRRMWNESGRMSLVVTGRRS